MPSPTVRHRPMRPENGHQWANWSVSPRYLDDFEVVAAQTEVLHPRHTRFHCNQSINQSINSIHFISFIDLFCVCVCVCACVSHGSLQSNQHNYNQQLIQAFNRTPAKPPQSNPPPPPPPPPPPHLVASNSINQGHQG